MVITDPSVHFISIIPHTHHIEFGAFIDIKQDEFSLTEDHTLHI